jgi:RNA polymerase sigma-70 factor (ECF subfamily)
MRLSQQKSGWEKEQPVKSTARPAPTGPTDEALMQRFQQGDGQAFKVLLERHRRGVFNFVLRHVGDSSAAEDLLQDTFLRVVQGAHRYKLESKFTTWLYTIARNLCVDRARKMKFRRHRSLDQPVGSDDESPLGDRIADSGAPTDRQAIGTELQVKLEQAIATLREDQREVFVMREYSNLPFKEIAEIIGVPENTVKSRMRYALEHLRRALTEYQDYAKALV